MRRQVAMRMVLPVLLVIVSILMITMTARSASLEHIEKQTTLTDRSATSRGANHRGANHRNQTANHSIVPYGTAYVWSSDFSDLEGMRVRLQYVHSLGVHTLIQMHNPYAPPSQVCRFLDEADALGIQVIARLSGTTDVTPPWGWDGNQFNWDRLTAFLANACVIDHPALLAIYGFHIPWHDFTPSQIQQFYTEYHQRANDIPLYHDLVWVNETPESALLPGMCDLCEISSMPHSWNDGNPVNNGRHVTEKIVRYTSHIRQADPDAQIWIQAQTFGWDDAPENPNFRMPTADDMRWHADLLMAHVDLDGLLWYPYLHTYPHQLGDQDMDAQRQAVYDVYLAHFVPDWTPIDWIYLPLVIK
ncbi:MAG: hypothetical protein JXA89_16545 [Anaerolineae bacterium]|nr:hypothetical protein [Anaerolineae bacterium]